MFPHFDRGWGLSFGLSVCDAIDGANGAVLGICNGYFCGGGRRKFEDRHGKRILCIIPIDLDGYLFSRHCKFKFTSDLRERRAAKFEGW